MAQSINTNVASLSAQRYLSRNQAELTTAMTRLSSGMRINSARDDAAGMTLAERMTTQIRSLNVASRNANDAIALAQTAEAAMGSVASALQRIRELAVQSANASYSDSDRATMNKEARELIEEVKRVSTNTAFNGVNLLDGSFQDQQFQIGANSGQTLNLVALADARVTSLGRSAVALDGSAAGSLLGDAVAASTSAAAGTNGVNAVTSLTFTNPEGTTSPIAWASGASAKAIAAAINMKAASLGITATATNSATIGSFSTTGSMSMALNGTTVSANLISTGDLTPLADAINGADTGVTAVFANPPAKDKLLLTAADGSDIRIENFLNGTSTMKVEGSKSGATAQTLTSGGNDSTIVPGTLDVESTKGALSWAGAVGETASIEEVFGTGKSSGIAGLQTLSTLDLGNMTGAVSAIKVVDAALDQISNARGTLGAVQSRMELLIANVEVVSENITNARGRLVDADFAKETAALARVQILQQAGTAMLAQANAMPQQVLQLLKS
ncbi:MAG: flagellin [Betaproteobacteria bacterium]